MEFVSMRERGKGKQKEEGGDGLIPSVGYIL
jgi:hypothetical protein